MGLATRSEIEEAVFRQTLFLPENIDKSANVDTDPRSAQPWTVREFTPRGQCVALDMNPPWSYALRPASPPLAKGSLSSACRSRWSTPGSGLMAFENTIRSQTPCHDD